MRKTLCLLLACGFLRSGLCAADSIAFGSLEGAYATGNAARGAGPETAYGTAGSSFEGSSAGGGFVSPPPVLGYQGGGSSAARPNYGLVVGEPGRSGWSEPRNPLTAQGEVKKPSSKGKMLWAGGAALAGAGIGFLLAGPIGAIGGAVLGLVVGWSLAR